MENRDDKVDIRLKIERQQRERGEKARQEDTLESKMKRGYLTNGLAILEGILTSMLVFHYVLNTLT